MPLVDRVFGQILPEVRREFERSSEWRRYQEGLLNVAHAQASGTAPEASTRKAQDVANAEDRPAVPRAGESSAAGGMRKFPSFRPHAWERVEMRFCPTSVSRSGLTVDQKRRTTTPNSAVPTEEANDLIRHGRCSYYWLKQGGNTSGCAFHHA